MPRSFLEFVTPHSFRPRPRLQFQRNTVTAAAEHTPRGVSPRSLQGCVDVVPWETLRHRTHEDLGYWVELASLPISSLGREWGRLELGTVQLGPGEGLGSLSESRATPCRD